MRFSPAAIAGVFVVETDILADSRGSFARAYCETEFSAAGLNTRWAQHNISHNQVCGTLRGLHFQCAPHEEIKVIRCVSGSVFDVLVDLRPSSPSFRQWAGFNLSASNGRALYVPEGLAHGFQTLEDHSTMHYLMSSVYVPESARGIVWNDPDLAIAWPEKRLTISDADQRHPSLATLFGQIL